jgi:multiple antibiotic resistance protein
LLSSLASDISGVIPLFLSTFTTLFAIINPLEVMPLFLSLTRDKTPADRRDVALKACLYALGLIVFFLFFGAMVLKMFGVSLDMVRVVGGVVLMRIGFALFLPSPSGQSPFAGAGPNDNIAFVPLAMPLLCGPGGFATVLGMIGTIRKAPSEAAAYAAILSAAALAIFATYLCLVFSGRLVFRLGPMGIDALTRIVGFFVSAIGVSLIFDGVFAAIDAHGIRVVL